MSKLNRVALAAAVALIGATGANAGCLITSQNNTTKEVPLGTCLYMSSAHDFAASAAKECGVLTPVHEPSWNDTIVKIGATEPASVGLMMSHLVDENSMTITFKEPGEYVLDARFSADATIMYCY